MDKHLNKEELFDFAEGLLNAAARASADTHLQSCAECRSNLEVTSAYFNSVSNLETVRAPANFLANVRARIEKPSLWKSIWGRFVIPGRLMPTQFALLTLLGFTIIASYLYQNGRLPDSMPSESSSLEVRSEQPKREEMKKRENQNTEMKDSELPVLSNQALASGKSAVDKVSAEAPAEASTSIVSTVTDEPPARSALAAPKPLAKSAPMPSSDPPPLSQDDSKLALGRAYSAEENSGDVALSEIQEDKIEASVRQKPLKSKVSKSGSLRDAAPMENHQIVFEIRNIHDTTLIWTGFKNLGVELTKASTAGDLKYHLTFNQSTLPQVQTYLERFGKMIINGSIDKNSNTALSIELQILPSSENSDR